MQVVGLEWGPLSLVSTIEELLERKSSGSGLESREYGCRDLSRWPRVSFYPQKLALTSPISGGRSVGIVRSRTQATEFSLVFSHNVMHTKEQSLCEILTFSFFINERSVSDKCSSLLPIVVLWIVDLNN
jgi:hypothetical protein